MERILVACADYPRGDGHAMQFVHTRNKYYISNGLWVIVLNFACENSYMYENIQVISLRDFYKNKHLFDSYLLICHAPNVRNHFKFLYKNYDLFKKRIYFFHGHEVVNITKAYPPPYAYMDSGFIKTCGQNIYDRFKLNVWKNFFFKKDTSAPLVFVSHSLKKDFIRYVRILPELLEERAIIINNSVGEIFEKRQFDRECHKIYDFITIRSNIDSSVYCIDLITEIAFKNPEKKFLLIGRGTFFDHNLKPDNLDFINQQMSQEELIKYINMCKVALMPTRRDSQGVMTCELATFGIPVITSDLDVCKEMFSSFENVRLCSEEEMINIQTVQIGNTLEKNTKFFSDVTISKEINMIVKGE